MQQLKISVISIALVAVIGLFTFTSASGSDKNQSAAASINTAQFFSEASAMAAESGKPILLVFTGKNTNGKFWCPPCASLDKAVFETKAFKDWAESQVVKLEIILPRDNWESEEIRQHNQDLAAKYQISSVPTVILTDAEGRVLGKNPSRSNPQSWIADATAIIAGN